MTGSGPGRSYTKDKWAWAFYDWANSAYATAVMAGFFPVFFKQYWQQGVPVVESTFRLGMANSIASLIIAASAPFLGALADRMGRRKGLLLVFAALGLTMTGGLYWVTQGSWMLALAVYVTATVGFSGSVLFTDSLLPFLAGDRELDRLSALGFALGYLGGGILFAFTVVMVQFPDWFGFADASDAVRLAFVLVAVWWAVFSIPLLLWVKEPPPVPGKGQGSVPGDALRQLGSTLAHIRQYRAVALFLIAYWLYIDGVDTIIRMAVDYGLALGFPAESLITALLITQFVGFPAALLFGRVGERWGPKTGIYIGLVVYVMATSWGAMMDNVREFYVLAVAVGLVQGGVQSLSRSLFARLIPANRSAEFFGFYNLLGKFAAILGPFLVGWVGAMTGNPRVGILSVLVLFVAGGALLYRVRQD